MKIDTNLQILKQQKEFVLSKKYLLLASAYESLENKNIAVKYYKEALFYDCECFQAFDKLTKNNLIQENQILQLIDQLRFSS